MITRDNYEEFFLLYTDNELSAAERHEVERFVADHPDLREDWEALLQTKLSPDQHLAFPDREALLKPEIEGSAWTGDLLSYIDGELDEQHTARIEAALRQYPLVERELAILRQTVIRPDLNITFPEKDRLYRTEKDRRIVAFPWLRAGIAAAVAGAIALLLLLPARRSIQPGKPGIASVTPHDPPVTTQKIVPAVTPPPVAALQSMEGQSKPRKGRPAKQIFQRRESQQPQDVAMDIQKDGSTAATLNKADPATEIHNADPVTTTKIGSTPPPRDLAADVHFAVQTGIPKEQSSFATQALQEEAGDQRNILSDEPAAPGKAALRGLFRKVKRAFGKTAERDSDGNRQVLVGAFQVNID